MQDNILNGFTISGGDKPFVPATTIILKDVKSVRVLSEEVRYPVTVRYAWENISANAHLGNSAHLLNLLSELTIGY